MAHKLPQEFLDPFFRELIRDSENSKENIQENIKKNMVTKEECKSIVKTLATTHGINESQAFSAIALLFLKGAANRSAPETMSVTVTNADGTKTEVLKYDVMYACHTVCKHKFLRRLAESLAVEISVFAETQNLNRDLAVALNNCLLAQGDPPLTSKEKAWASSFCQALPGLDTYVGQCVPAKLAADYNGRFVNKKPKNAPAMPTASPKVAAATKKKEKANY